MNRTQSHEDGNLPTTWYRRSTFPHDTHTGRLDDGVVYATCGIEFYLPRLVRSTFDGPPSDPGSLCETCRNVERRASRPVGGGRP